MAGAYKHQPEGVARQRAELDGLQQQIDALRKALTGVGLHIDGATGDLVFDASHALRTENFDGDLGVPSAGTMGVALGGPHNTLVIDDIVLRGQIIGNNALTSPVAADVAADTVASLTYTSGIFADRVTADLVVPSGFTQALVFAHATAGTTFASPGTISVAAKIGSVAGATISEVAGGGAANSPSAGFSRLVTGLSPGNLAVICMAGGTGGTSNSGNARISAIAVFLR
jgi:hypothetical protein